MSSATRNRRSTHVRTAHVFAALGDSTRLSLVSRLSRDGPASISALTAGTGITRQAVSKHLEVLEQSGLVRGSRRGRERLWEFRRGPVDDAREQLARISAQWDDAIERLRALVEE
ncbi:MAG: Transcriptional regulator, ArsR family [Gemmatimonadetes bacterium]|nr:Transcriptional regulator, ArsR family [Gemmatimonadota bacterium]